MKGENDTTIPKHYGEELNLKWLDKDHVPGQSDIGVFKWGHDDSCQCVEFSHDGDFVASGSCDGYVCIWDPKTTDCVSTLDHREKWVFDVKFSPDDYQLATAAADCAADGATAEADCAMLAGICCCCCCCLGCCCWGCCCWGCCCCMCAACIFCI